MRPALRFLSDALIERIVSEARDLLGSLGVEIHNDAVLSVLNDHGARIDKSSKRAYLTQEIIDSSLATAPDAVKLFDALGREALDLSGEKIHFTPGSAAIHVLDARTGTSRHPVTADYVRYAKLMTAMDHLASQSTAMIPSDVHERISDSYRLFLSILYCSKPIVTGTFTTEAFEVMRDLQLIVRGSEQALVERPLTIFSCCPTSPLKWSDVTSQNVVDCAQHSIPVEYISMPLTGFIAPVTLVGTLVQHTAETLSGVVISQLTKPGAPALWGGSPAIFDVRYETTPMGAIGTMMVDCAANEIGKHLGFPTQAYIGLSDAKLLDAQAGLESSMGATLAALSGINNVSGPGMLDFESLFSCEKLVVDNEICGMTKRLVRGIEPREDFPARPRFEELLAEQHLLISEHTRKYLREEICFPGPLIDRANRSRWREEGGLTLLERAEREIDEILREYEPVELPQDVLSELYRRMESEARRHGMDGLPARDA
ncbi:MAG: trimethylamine methyltransferase family protein [Acidobacteriota bacterium]|nr:MAG: trimethylamine methyltransferase family protein [Acidobacteriota bacterium]